MDSNKDESATSSRVTELPNENVLKDPSVASSTEIHEPEPSAPTQTARRTKALPPIDLKASQRPSMEERFKAFRESRRESEPKDFIPRQPARAVAEKSWRGVQRSGGIKWPGGVVPESVKKMGTKSDKSESSLAISTEATGKDLNEVDDNGDYIC